MEGIAEKIRKILAKATSSNENEATAALLKARELMAKYKLSDEEIYQDEKETKLRVVPYVKDTFSDIKNAWFVRLSRVIAENHCCTTMISSKNGKKILQVAFVGIHNDPIIACDVFAYAVRHITRKSRAYKSKLSKVQVQDYFCNYLRYPPEYVVQQTHRWESSYVTGFVRGLQAQYEKQFENADQETGNLALALTMPEKVKEFEQNIKEKNNKVIKEDSTNKEAIRQGFKDGYNFDLTKTIKKGLPSST